MDKEFNSRGEDDYFQSLPDELVIFVFTKLSNSDSDDNNFLEDLKSLGRCSSVSKRFNALTCLVPAISVKHGNIEMLYKYCPEILKKFKHIRSLQVTHWSCLEIRMMCERKRLPIICWEASYKPHSYCLAVVSCKKISCYYDDPQKQQSLMVSDAAAEDEDFYELTRHHTVNMIYLHHMLVSSIKDHKYLRKVVVTDFSNRGMLILEEDSLAELRNCTSTNLEHVVSRDRSGYVINLNIPILTNRLGLVMNSVCFNIIEWSEKATDDHTHKDDDDDDNAGIPSGLAFKRPGGYKLEKALQSILENPDNVDDNEDDKVILEILSDLESAGNLL